MCWILLGLCPAAQIWKKKSKLIKLKLIKIPQLFPSISLTWVLLFIFLFYNKITFSNIYPLTERLGNKPVKII